MATLGMGDWVGVAGDPAEVTAAFRQMAWHAVEAGGQSPQVWQGDPNQYVPGTTWGPCLSGLGLGLGAASDTLTREEKKLFSRQVNGIYEQAQSGIPDPSGGLRAALAAVRSRLMAVKAWTDGGRWWLLEDWDTHRDLLAKLNNAQRLLINTSEPGRIARGAITSSGEARQDSPTAAGARTFVDEAGKIPGKVGDALGEWSWVLKAGVVVAGLAVAYPYAAPFLSRLRGRGSNPRRGSSGSFGSFEVPEETGKKSIKHRPPRSVDDLITARWGDTTYSGGTFVIPGLPPKRKKRKKKTRK